MKRLTSLFAAIVVMALSMAAGAQAFAANDEKPVVRTDKGTKKLFQPMADKVYEYLDPLADYTGKIRVEKISTKGTTLDIYFNQSLSEFPIRDTTVTKIKKIVKKNLPKGYTTYDTINIFTIKQNLEDLSSAYYSGRKLPAKARKVSTPLVTRSSQPFEISKGLDGRHIAMWQSHGWYYDQPLKRWEWQRARIFLTVEDLYTQSYVVPFLVPMLENAGANVLLPRERDCQVEEVIVDNDPALYGQSEGYSEWSGEHRWATCDSAGFANAQQTYVYLENPFNMGTARQVKTTSDDSRLSNAAWRADIPRDGQYAVYVSYQTLKNSTENAHYSVMHSGGVTEFSVNQKMGGGTWIYLGTFDFKKGRHADQGVMLTNLSAKDGEVVSCDAVKFGGGMGNIARKPSTVDADGNPKEIDYDVDEQTSGYPRFTEGARYWLQWAGFEPDIYSVNKDQNDYNDDYQSRGLWVNALALGSNRLPRTAETANTKGYNIPVDLSFAFHTDAGTTLNDTIVGTLAIYTRIREDNPKLPDGTDRNISRELCDLVQTQIVDDVRATFEPIWTRRGLWDRSYAESRYPQVPAMLLEFLSHQNFADMRYGLDPTFRFTVSRAIYKGILRFVSASNGTPYVVQPLPVKNFSATIIGQRGENFAQLKWQPREDPLEPSAKPTAYVVYTSKGDNGFDNGRLVTDNICKIDIEPGIVYNFKVVAVNEGGASFPSEILSVAKAAGEDKGTVLIVNGFDRISAPASYATADTTRAGFLTDIDAGVPYVNDFLYIGAMHESRRHIPWMDDDAPGFGASYGDMESKVIAGNTFDYPRMHGKAFLNNGLSFVSTSRDALTEGMVSMNDYEMADIILGKQLTTQVGRRGACELRYRVFPIELQNAITKYTAQGGRIVLSGANIATDIWDTVFDFEVDSTMNAQIIEPSKKFAQEVLHWRWMTNYAGHTGEVRAQMTPAGFSGTFNYETKMNDRIYQVDAPDGLNPVGEKAYTIFRYGDNSISAGVAYDGDDYKVVSLGFPIETLQDEGQINELIKQVCDFLQK